MIAALRLMLVVLGIACLGGAVDAVAQPAPGREVLRVGTFPENRPWVFRDGAGALTGFEVDMVAALVDELGMSAKTVPMAFRELFPALEDGRIDIAVCSISLTPERLARFDATQPYYETSQGVVVLASSRIRTLDDLAGRTVTVEPGSENEQWLKANSVRYRFGKITPAQGQDAAIALLRSGAADAYFGDLPALLYRLLKAPDLAVVMRLPTDDRYAILLPRGSPLTERLDAALSAIKRDGRLARIHQRWFGSPPPPGSLVNTVVPRS